MNRLNGTLRLLAAMMTCVLASCGGGGGSSSSNAPVVTANASSFELVGIVPNPSASNSIVFTLTGGGGGPYYAEAISDLANLQAALQVNSDVSATVSLNDTSSTATTGRRSGTVTFSLCSDQACKNVLWTNRYPVQVARFQVATAPLTLVGHEGTDTASTLTVTPADTDHLLTLSTTTNDVAGSSAWLALAHDASGNLAVDASALSKPAGNYSGSLVLGTPYASTLVSIPVSFNVGAGLLMPALADVVERIDTTSASLHGSGTLTFAGNGGPWSASSDVAWLVVDSPAGSGAGALAYHVDASAADAVIANWSSGIATITVKSPGLSDATSTLTYRRQMPEITTVTPSQVWPGQSATVKVTGRGLSQLAGTGQIKAGSQVATGGTIDSDTHATLQLPPLAAGSLQVSVPNPLNLAAAQANLAVTAGRLPYAVLPTSGAKNAIVYDPSRQAVFASDYDASTLLRWKLGGSTWAVTAVPWAGIWRVQLSPDRQTLYVLAAGSLSEVDPDTLTVRTTHAGWTWSGFDFDEAPPVTSDLRMWLPESGTQYFDLRTHAFAFAPASEFPGVGLTTTAATPDGAYLYSVDGSTSPAPPDGWYSAATQANTPLPAGVLERAYRVSFDLDGSLGLFDWQSVYHTGTWTLAGTASLPSGENGVGGVISPDGTRVYRLVGSTIVAFDTTQLQPGTSQFVQVGTFGVPDSAVDCSAPECDVVGRLVIDQLGTNLFWVGNKNFMVIPIPANMAGPAAARTGIRRLLPSAAMAAAHR